MYFDFLDISILTPWAARFGRSAEGGLAWPRPAGLGQGVGPEGLLVYIRGPSPGSCRKAPLGARGTSLLIGCHNPRARHSESDPCRSHSWDLDSVVDQLSWKRCLKTTKQ